MCNIILFDCNNLFNICGTLFDMIDYYLYLKSMSVEIKFCLLNPPFELTKYKNFIIKSIQKRYNIQIKESDINLLNKLKKYNIILSSAITFIDNKYLISNKKLGLFSYSSFLKCNEFNYHKNIKIFTEHDNRYIKKILLNKLKPPEIYNNEILLNGVSKIDFYNNNNKIINEIYNLNIKKINICCNYSKKVITFIKELKNKCNNIDIKIIKPTEYIFDKYNTLLYIHAGFYEYSSRLIIESGYLNKKIIYKDPWNFQEDGARRRYNDVLINNYEKYLFSEKDEIIREFL